MINITKELNSLVDNNFLDRAMEDYTIFKLNHLVWTNKEELWRKWIRQ